MHNSTSSIVLLYHGLGLEDHVICAGLVFYMAQVFIRVVVAVHIEDLYGFKFLFRNADSVRPFLVDSYDFISDNFVFETFGNDVRTVRMGRQKKDSVGYTLQLSHVSYPESFYQDAGLSYEIRWSHFLIEPNHDVELLVMKKARVGGPFAIVADDPSSMVYVDTTEIPDEAPILRISERSPPFGASTIFELRVLLESATLIHVADGAVARFVEHLNVSAQRKVLHRYASRQRNAGLPQNPITAPSHLLDHWEVMSHPVGTSHLGLQILNPIADSIFDLESITTMDVLFSIRAHAAVSAAGFQLYASIDQGSEPLLGTLHPLEVEEEAAFDSPCRFAFNGQHPAEREGTHCDMALSLHLPDLLPNLLTNRLAHSGAHTLRLTAQGLYPRTHRSAAASVTFHMHRGLGQDLEAHALPSVLPPAPAPPAAGEAAGAPGLTRTEAPLGLNFAAQERLYAHHGVFRRMPRRRRPVDPYAVTEFTGLRVPRRFDCGNLDPGGGRLGAYSYYTAVPSRWFPCHGLERMLRAGQKAFVPEYPVIDEEYPEAAAVYEVALAAPAAAGGRLAVVDVGARWGTWAFRAAAAAREYNGDVTGVDLLVIEPNREACAAVWEVARRNGFEPPYVNLTVRCEAAAPAAVRAWAAEREVVDLVDMDIQGAEYWLLPQVGDVLRDKVRRLIVGTHSEHDSEEHVSALARAGLAGSGSDWRVVREGPFKGAHHIPGYERCVAALREEAPAAGWRKAAALASAECRAAAVETPWGPLAAFDGELILDNRRLPPIRTDF